jgi:COP9 signalosome complex subunit 6
MYGALLASQSGRDIDIVNCFDLPLSVNGKDDIVLDKAFLLYKLEQCKL